MFGQIEYGVFNDEGCIADDFYDKSKAEAFCDKHCADEDVFIDEICPDHKEQPKNGCEECNADEEE